MGSYASKPNNDASLVVHKRDADVNDNPDPRSPTPEVTRTPLHNKSASKLNITKNIDLRKTFENAKEEKLIHNSAMFSAIIKNHLQLYDPRSPTQDFERTPITLTSSKIDELNQRKLMHQKCEFCLSPHLGVDNNICTGCSEANAPSPQLIIPKILYEEFHDMTLNDSLEETSEPLGSSTASHEAIENISNKCKEQTPTTLLETNFDYVESVEKFEDSHESLTSKPDKYIEKIPTFEILDEDPRSPSTGIDRTPIVIPKTDNDSEDDKEEMSDDSLIKVLQDTNAELRQAKPMGKNTEELLIHEDEATYINDTLKKSKSTSNNGARTPLTCIKNKDAGRTRSKIPRSKRTNHISTDSKFCVSVKNISKACSVGGVCENTPPHSHQDRWDKDSSIVL